ncbi:ATP-binding protein [Actinocorallia longicatena]|uniref:Histidine kinase/HSP90-like ATPase domain-containing protein n=1 Tax=Actinocorallia longicatena TaxID=111803 RepID=A0ABP6QGN3_9ACTN
METAERRRFEVMVLPGVPRAATAARQVLRDLLVDGHPGLADAEVCMSELIANALRHTSSGVDGGRVRVEVEFGKECVRIKVVDDGGGDSTPRLVEGDGESGRGMTIVDALSSSWDVEYVAGKTGVWFEIRPDPGP